VNCFQITPLVSQTYFGKPSSLDGKLMWMIPEEAHDPLDEIVSPYKQSAHFYLDQVNFGNPPAPWVFVILPREYKIAQHIWDIRTSKEALTFSMHKVNPSPLPEGFVPTVGCIVTYNKNDFFIHSKRSPLLNRIWKGLSNKDEHSHWLCILGGDHELRELEELEMAIAS
jgi:hypothetical protein